MKQHIFIVLIWFALASTTQAASFDCAIAQSKLEKIICSSPTLSELDERLDEAYSSAKAELYEEEVNLLVSEQKNWLRKIRNKCADEVCLSNAYQSRIDEIEILDPSVVNKLTCEKMRKYSDRIFSLRNIDLGSGYGSPNEVDYGCPESLSSFPYLHRLLAIAEAVRNGDGPSFCTGSIIHAQWRYYHFDLTKAGFAPSIFLKQREDDQSPTSYTAKYYPAGLYKNQLAYFQQWAEQSIYNYRLHIEFFTEFNSSLPKLTEYYRKKFGLSQNKAEVTARSALMLIVQRAAGSFPMDILYDSPSQIVNVARNPVSNINDFRMALESGSNERYHLYEALTVSLLNNRPKEIVALLVSKMPREEIARIDVQLEPLLSFAVGSEENLRLLLANGAPVDAANEFGKTSLFYAIGFNAHDAAEILLINGANVNHSYLSEKELRPDADQCFYPNLKHTKRTPLMHAAQNSDVKMLNLLIHNGAQLTDKDELGLNAFDYAVMGKKDENAAYLSSLQPKGVMH